VIVAGVTVDVSALVNAAALVLVALIGLAGIWVQVRAKRAVAVVHAAVTETSAAVAEATAEVAAVHAVVNSAADAQQRKLDAALDVIASLRDLMGNGIDLPAATRAAMLAATERSPNSRTRLEDFELPRRPPS
jgi:hypothetical protein